MTLKAHTIVEWIAARTGSQPDASAGISIANAAGDILVSPPDGRTWSYYKRRALLSVVSGQDYLSLPDNFASLIYAQYGDSRLDGLQDSSVPTVLDEKRWSTHGNNLQSFIYEVPVGGSEAIPRILLAKTPTANDPNAVRLYYVAGWTELAEPSSEADLAHWMYPLYRELVHAVALGYEEPDAASTSLRVAEVWAGPIAASAFARDAKVQRYFGLPRNAITSQVASSRPEHFDETVLNS